MSLGASLLLRASIRFWSSGVGLFPDRKLFNALLICLYFSDVYSVIADVSPLVRELRHSSVLLIRYSCFFFVLQSLLKSELMLILPVRLPWSFWSCLPARCFAASVIGLWYGNVID